MTCLAVGAALLTLAGPGFTLSWTHSVERVEWQEEWRVERATLILERARVRGSGAGMEPGEGAVLEDGWWVWPADLRVPSLTLAASGATGAGWRLCSGGTCHEIGARSAAPLNVKPCPAAGSP